MNEIVATVPGTNSPISFLDGMAGVGRERVARARRDEPEAALRRRARATPRPPRLALDGFALFAEIKLAAPSADGPVRAPRLAERVAAYVDGGAAAISVLTEPTRFGGSLAHLCLAARHAGAVPVLRKDFVVDPYQVLEARAAGAAGVLLIAELLGEELLDACLRSARELDLFVLLEAFDPEQAARARRRATADDDPAPVLCGINCRDLRTLRVDPQRFAALAPPADGTATIAESGLRSAAEVEAIARLGYRGALVGGALMCSEDPADLVAGLRAAGRRGRCAPR
jgi:indole-3-glycerol phosphate synthase